MKIFKIRKEYKSDLNNRTITIFKWSFGFEPIKLKSDDQKILKVSCNKLINTFEIRKKIRFRDLKTLLDEISKANVCSFKGTNKSSVIKIYIDKNVYFTRTKGKLRVKNKKFKTNLDWLRNELKNRGLEDTTPQNW